jgi:hypothetical protein
MVRERLRVADHCPEGSQPAAAGTSPPRGKPDSPFGGWRLPLPGEAGGNRLGTVRAWGRHEAADRPIGDCLVLERSGTGHLAGRCERLLVSKEGERPVEVLVVVIIAVVVLRIVLGGITNARRIADHISRYLEAPHGPTRRDRHQQ